MEFPHNTQIGDVVDGVTVTEIKGTRVFGVATPLPQETVDKLKAHFAKPENERGFIFRPGTQVGELSPAMKKMKPA